MIFMANGKLHRHIKMVKILEPNITQNVVDENFDDKIILNEVEIIQKFEESKEQKKLINKQKCLSFQETQIKNNTISNHHEDFKTIIKLYVVYMSCLMYVADLLSDWYLLLFTYLVNRDFIKLQLTFIIMLCSAVIVGYKYHEQIKNKSSGICKLFLYTFNMGPLVFEFGRIKLIKDGRTLTKDEDALAAYSRFTEVISEAIPQLTLQLAVVLSNYIQNCFTTDSDFYTQLASMVTSSLGILTNCVRGYKQRSIEDSNRGFLIGIALNTILFCRVYLVSVLFAIHPLRMGGAVSAHIWISTLYVWFFNPEYEDFVDRMVGGYLLTISPVFYDDKHFTLRHILSLTENLGMMICILVAAAKFLPLIIATIFFVTLHIIALAITYINSKKYVHILT